MGQHPNLIIFVKTPQLGHVKSRLAVDIGSVQATRAYRTMSAALLRRLAYGPAFRRYVFVAPAKNGALGRWHRRFRRRQQSTGDLGARMADAFRRMPPGPSILIGSDIPTIDWSHLRAACRQLNNADVVFGPATDGGFWLVGFANFRRRGSAFKNIRWSGPNALSDTVNSLSAGQKVAFADQLDDVDTGADWRRYQHQKNAKNKP